MTNFTAWIEQTDFSTWIRESPSLLVFPFFLILHAWGMGFLAGANAAIDLRILGIAPRVQLNAMTKFYPVAWVAFVVNAISGLLLLIAYPTKALTNPVFYLKLACIAAGMVLMVLLRRRVVEGSDAPPPWGKALAFLSILLWAGAIVSGRLLAYTCRLLMAGSPC